MMKAKNIFLFAILSLALLVSACSSDSPESGGVKKGKENVATPIANADTKWTYYSLEDNKPVGTSNFSDSIADKQWAARTDWDIAVCGDLIRTNSGDSGIGQGGIQVSPEDYSTLKTAPESGYATDVYE